MGGWECPVVDFEVYECLEIDVELIYEVVMAGSPLSASCVRGECLRCYEARKGG